METIRPATIKKDPAEYIEAGIWEHYKGGRYLVLGVGAHTETQERLIFYVAISDPHRPGPALWVRPIAMWHELVPHPETGEPVPRFRYVGLERR
jgi:hypothetical protein